MYRIKMGTFDLWSPECPRRTASSGVAHLAVVLSAKKDGAFLLPAHDGESEVATVNGVPVWSLAENDWADSSDGDNVTRWEHFASSASPLDESSDGESAVGADAQSVIDAVKEEAGRVVREASEQVRALTEAAEAHEQEVASLNARIEELEAEAAAKDPE